MDFSNEDKNEGKDQANLAPEDTRSLTLNLSVSSASSTSDGHDSSTTPVTSPASTIEPSVRHMDFTAMFNTMQEGIMAEQLSLQASKKKLEEEKVRLRCRRIVRTT